MATSPTERRNLVAYPCETLMLKNLTKFRDRDHHNIFKAHTLLVNYTKGIDIPWL